MKNTSIEKEGSIPLSKLDYTNVPKTLPVIFLPCAVPIYSYCYSGKKTLKDLFKSGAGKGLDNSPKRES